MREDAYNFLLESTTAVIATSYKNNPKASTVYFVVDQEFNFYFITKRNTSKYFHATLNPKAAIVVGTGPEPISVTGHGTIEIIVDEDEIDRISDLMSAKKALKNIKSVPIRDMKDLENGPAVVFKIIPDELTFMNLSTTVHTKSASDQFIKIIPNN